MNPWIFLLVAAFTLFVGFKISCLIPNGQPIPWKKAMKRNVSYRILAIVEQDLLPKHAWAQDRLARKEPFLMSLPEDKMFSLRPQDLMERKKDAFWTCRPNLVRDYDDEVAICPS
jgi:hypothetical protein